MKIRRLLSYNLHVADGQRRQKRHTKRTEIKHPFAWTLEIPEWLFNYLVWPHKCA